MEISSSSAASGKHGHGHAGVSGKTPRFDAPWIWMLLIAGAALLGLLFTYFTAKTIIRAFNLDNKVKESPKPESRPLFPQDGPWEQKTSAILIPRASSPTEFGGLSPAKRRKSRSGVDMDLV